MSKFDDDLDRFLLLFALHYGVLMSLSRTVTGSDQWIVDEQTRVLEVARGDVKTLFLAKYGVQPPKEFIGNGHTKI